MSAVTDETQDRLTRDRLEAILTAVGVRAGVDVRDPHLVKFTNNAVFRLTRAPVVVRIAGSATTRQRVEKVVHVSRWLAEHEVPAVRLFPGIEQPVAVEGHLATIWETVPAVGPKPTGRDLAAILRRFHALPPPTFLLPAWRPVAEIRQRLGEADGLDAADLAFLLERCDAIEDEVSRVEYALSPGPIHGDAFLGNLIPGEHGPVICDFDSTSIGPREWDLAPVALGKLRFNYAGDAHDELATHYGFDVTRWGGFPALRQVRELKLVTSVVPILRSNPSIREQWAFRFASFRTGDTDAKWTPYE